MHTPLRLGSAPRHVSVPGSRKFSDCCSSDEETRPFFCASDERCTCQASASSVFCQITKTTPPPPSPLYYNHKIIAADQRKCLFIPSIVRAVFFSLKSPVKFEVQPLLLSTLKSNFNLEKMKNHVLLLVFLTSLVLVSGSFFPKTSNDVDVQGPAFSFGVMTAIGSGNIAEGKPWWGGRRRRRFRWCNRATCGIGK